MCFRRLNRGVYDVYERAYLYNAEGIPRREIYIAVLCGSRTSSVDFRVVLQIPALHVYISREDEGDKRGMNLWLSYVYTLLFGTGWLV